ncbi:MAG: hypothetical protein U0R79_03200 [Propionicimonas sp.]
MVEAGGREAAELAYQRALASLHDVRADLADVAAARRRLAFDRPRLDPPEALRREQDLAARFDELSARAGRLRDEAAALREAVRRLHGEGAVEPVELPPETPSGRFEQPPFPEQA